MDLSSKVPPSLRRLGGYVLTGGSAAAIDLGIFAALSHGPLPIPVAAACSFCIAAVENYVMTSLFVFRTSLSAKRLASFFLFALIGLGVNVSVTVLSITMAQLGPIVAKILGIGVAFFMNFWLNSVIVFRHRPGAPPSKG